MSIKILNWESQTEGNLKEKWIGFPQRMRGQNPYGLPVAMMDRFFEMPYPGKKNFWVAEENGAVVGICQGSISPNFSEVCFAGFFDVDLSTGKSLEISQALLQGVSSWAKQNSCKQIVGPLNYSTWFSYRFRTSWSDNNRYVWEPNHPQEYVGLWREFGFTALEEYHTHCLELDSFIEHTRPAYEKAIDEGFKFRPFDAKNLLEREVPILHHISMECFKNNYLFEALPLEAFRELYVPIANKLDLSLAFFMLDQNEKEVGFAFFFPEPESFVMKTMAILPEGRGHGLSNAVSYLSAQQARQRQNAKYYIPAMVRQGAQSESYGKHSKILWKHEYTLFKKDL